MAEGAASTSFMSISTDMGKTWSYSATEFPPISGGQRLVLLRLKEGPLFFASFRAICSISSEIAL